MAGWAAAMLVAGSVHAQDQPPRFQSSVDVTSVDATVVDGRGQPVTDLTADDFSVTIDGKPRRVLSSEWVPLAGDAAPGDAPSPPPEGYSSNASTTGGRVILLVIDQPNIRFGGAFDVRTAVNEFIDRLEPSDRVAAVGIGPGSVSTPFTSDKERVKQAIGKMPGSRTSRIGQEYNIGVSEAMEIRAGMSFTLQRVQERECAGLPQGQMDICLVAVENEALTIAMEAERDAEMTYSTLRNLLAALREIDAPKTIVLVSGGFVLGDQRPSMDEISSLAAASRTSIYALQLNELLADASVGRPSPTVRQDQFEMGTGLSALTAAARGTLFNIAVGADAAFDRIESELSGYYLLGVESDPGFKDGKTHPIRVTANRRGVTVRSRSQLMLTAAEARPRTVREAVIAGLTSPLVLSALPLQVATFPLRAAEPGRVQLLIHADVGLDYAQSRVVSLAYMITDQEGKIVESQTADARLPPVMNGVPSPLQFTGGASLPPGEYRLKLAVAEGDRVGTIEHPFVAELREAGLVQVSELMVGGPVDPEPPLRPTVGHMVSFGLVHGYVETYGERSASTRVKYEVARDVASPPILTAQAEGRQAGGDRRIFTEILPVRQLPPDRYVLRATVNATVDGTEAPLVTLVRGFEVAPPAVLMTSADSTISAPTTTAEVFLPVVETMFARAFDSRQAYSPDVLPLFRDRVPADSRAAFDAGVASLREGDFPKAEASFKSTMRVDADSTPALAYLAAVYAASGHDLEAASAWQTALIEGSDLPEIYVWLSDTLLRIREFGQARTILEEAVAKWPGDARFAKPLAMLYATFGQGREAARLLIRHLDAYPEDREALMMGVEWIYNLHTSNAVARSPAEDVELARSYAEKYAQAGGPDVELVNQWMEVLEGRRR